MEWLSKPEVWISLFTLSILELVLGIDNVVFISILCGKLPKDQQPRGWRIGLILAIFPRVILLLAIGWVMKLTTPLFTLPFLQEMNPLTKQAEAIGITGQDLVFLIGGLFLIFKSVKEIHHKLEGEADHVEARSGASFGSIMFQIFLVNFIFSLDSVITAIGMVDKEKVGGVNIAVGIMIAAVILSTVMMLGFARAIGDFVEKHPTIKMLALAFLILIGVNLLGEGFHQHLPKGYTYFSMAFAIIVELLNIKLRKQAAHPVKLNESHAAPPIGGN